MSEGKDADVDRLTEAQIEQWRTALCDPDEFHAQALSELNALCDLALSALSQEAVRDEALDLGQFVNAASIGGGDSPHQVVEKLQRAINAAALKREPNAAGWNEKGVADIGVLPGEVDATAGPAPAAPESETPETDYAVALRLARETVERDDRENAAPSRVLRPGLTSEYQLAKALLSADDLLDREGINHDGTRRHDAELDRVLAMTDEEVRASLVAEGIDPDLAAQNTKYAINQVIQLVQLRRELSLAQTEIKGHMRVVKEVRVDALEEAAKVCDAYKEELLNEARTAPDGFAIVGYRQITAEYLAAAIRSLKSRA